MQNIESTIDNKKRQKESIFNSSSTVFWCLFDKDKQIDTVISFLNHFLLKRKITSVSMRLSVRTMGGDLLNEVIENINSPKVYSYSITELLKNSSITKGEFSVYIEFTSVDNLAVPFCAVTSEVVSRNTFDIVHTYGRALECSEFGSKIDFETSFETGWCIWNFGNQFKNHCVFHNGRLHANTSFELTLYHKGEELISLNKIEKELRPFESCRINLEEEINKYPYPQNVLEKISKANSGNIDIKIKINGLKSTFPRLLFISTKHHDKKNLSLSNLAKINFTHSNFDFDNANQPKSSANYGYINNPKYPVGIKSGFRYYPCRELNEISIHGKNNIYLPMEMEDIESLKVSSDKPIASRLVGSNWSRWNDEDFIKDCSTGTYIIEYNNTPGFWHWGRLIPRGKNISSILSLINPFATDNEEFFFNLRLFNNQGQCHEKDINFIGSKFYLNLSSNLDYFDDDGCWYVLNGEGIGKFNVFSTCFFDNLNDGTTEHAF